MVCFKFVKSFNYRCSCLIVACLAFSIVFCSLPQTVYAATVPSDQTIGYTIDSNGQMIFDRDEMAAITKAYQLEKDLKRLKPESVSKEKVKKQSSSSKQFLYFIAYFVLMQFSGF